VVHNGIIENHAELREELKGQGYRFESDTDTEVIAHMVLRAMDNGADLLHAVIDTTKQLHGAYAIAVMSRDAAGHVVGARRGSPLVAGIGEGEHFLGSDVQALIKETSHFTYLEEGDVAENTQDGLRIYTSDGAPVERPVRKSEMTADAVERGEYRHYMLKEIFEQPRAIADTLEGRIAGIPCSVEVASEYRYRRAVVRDGSLFLAVSQSGETADTLAALRDGKQRGYLGSLAICNVPESSLVRESDLVLMTRAGPEIGVASTKAFTTQLAALALLVIELARINGLPAAKYSRLVNELSTLPRVVGEVLTLEPAIAKLAERFVPKHHALFLGRGVHYPVALEGALKLKEISYIHAEAYPAGELKHGPLALVDADMPVIAVAPNNPLLEKLTSNLEEVRARGGELFVFADTDVPMSHDGDRGALLKVASGGNMIAPAVFTVPLQMLAYHVAVLRGTDVDQPRNLAKSVTVE
jgi:glucosamine--fructose-6-phosphate aminotransferase (isomerizing)